MMRTILGAAVTAMILAISPLHAAARAQQLDPQATADLNGQSLHAAQSGKSFEATGPKQSKSAAATSAKGKALSRTYAIRARIAKQKTQLAKAKKQSLKAKKQAAKSKKQALKTKKKQAA